jgi:hypothetical protein
MNKRLRKGGGMVILILMKARRNLMKKLSLLAVLALVLLLPAAAQTTIPQESQSDLYCVNVVIEKVFPYTKGYAVVYRSGLNLVDTVYIPKEWFSFSVHKAELHQLGHGKTRPSMSVFYKAGEFHLVKLYVTRDGADETWGIVTNAMNLDDRFEGIEKLQLKF